MMFDMGDGGGIYDDDVPLAGETYIGVDVHDYGRINFTGTVAPDELATRKDPVAIAQYSVYSQLRDIAELNDDNKRVIRENIERMYPPKKIVYINTKLAVWAAVYLFQYRDEPSPKLTSRRFKNYVKKYNLKEALEWKGWVAKRAQIKTGKKKQPPFPEALDLIRYIRMAEM